MNRTHGFSVAYGTPEYRTYRAWQLLRQRCSNPSAPDYPRYGARGIAFDPGWQSFEVFLRDVGIAPSTDHTIERIDSTKGYTPGNVKWATRKEQQHNIKTNRWITFRGETKICADWARHFNISRHRLYQRIRKVGEQAALEFYSHRRLPS